MMLPVTVTVTVLPLGVVPVAVEPEMLQVAGYSEPAGTKNGKARLARDDFGAESVF